MAARGDAGGWRAVLALCAMLATVGGTTAWIGPAAAAEPVAVRTGDHRGFGRVVIDLAPGMKHTLVRRDDRVTVTLSAPAGEGGGVTPSGGARPPRNVAALDARDGALELTLVAGARLRSYKLGDRLVLDVADPEPAAPRAQDTSASRPGAPPPGASPATPRPTATSRPAASQPAASQPAARPPASPSVAAPQPVAVADNTRGQSPDSRQRERDAAAALLDVPAGEPALVVARAPRAPVEEVASSPLGVSAAVAAAPEGDLRAPAPALTLPFGRTAGAAALRRGDAALVVFDERRPVDMSALRDDPDFAGAAITLLPGATVLRLTLAADRQLRLSRAEAGWTVTIVQDGPPTGPLLPIRAEGAEGRLRLAAAAPGQVVAVPDPLTGSSLLVGTQRDAGQGVAVERRSPEFALLPTWQGVAVMALTDALALRPQADGFLLAADAGRKLALSAPDSQIQAMTAAATASRRFDLPALPLAALHRRLQSARLSAATAAPQARTGQRRAVMQAQLALGMGVEMQAVATATLGEDARAAEEPDMLALSAIAALLAGRTGQSAGIDDPRQDGTDEVAFWRAVRAAQLQPGAPRAAAIFGSAMPLLLSYPTPLRDRLLPLALETMAQGGEAAAAKTVLAGLADAPGLGLARAMVAERTGEPAAALAQYDAVAGGSDRRARAQAARRAVDLRLAAGTLTPVQAANALEKLVYAWRGDDTEIATRLRVAELRAQSGAWRTALAGLREMASLFPDRDAVARRALADTFAASLAPDAQAKMSPLDLVALAEENADLLPGGQAGHELAVRLAERLMALDLPARALPVLEKLVDQAPPGVARATLGATLAGLRLDQGGAAAALETLSASVVEGPLPPELLERRTLIFARAAAATGDQATALAALAELGTPAALALRAGLLERAKDWPAAAAALSALARSTLPESGPLDAAQSRLVLRLAAAAAQAGDEPMLAGLHASLAPRLAQEQLRDLAALLSAAPVRGVADLPRAAQDVRLARAAPAALRTLAPAATP